jgi:hypothetical protein
MKSWNSYPVEIANLFNPAFCALLLRNAAKGYEERRGIPLPFELAVLVLPIVLHAESRRLLPGTTRTKFHNWLASKPEFRIGLSERIELLVPITKAAIIFAALHKVLELGPACSLAATSKRIASRSVSANSEVSSCDKSAYFFGKWIADSTDSATVFSLLGIRP